MRYCDQFGVLIICPTGFLVYSYKARLPHVAGVENIRVDTVQGVLNYKRPGADSKVKWAPPSALRRIELILIDEASQYEDREWERLFTSIQEQPHKPYTGVVADFQQLQPIVRGGFCRQCCEAMACREMDMVYRSTDEAHLIFQNSIRADQPNRQMLEEYFDGRQWRARSLTSAVEEGMKLAERHGQPFMWLTSTNKGSSDVSQAALDLVGITEEVRSGGYQCDPNTKSTLPIIGKPGVVIRLSRNFDKQRGFVNGATAVIQESLQGNGIFTAKLVGSGNMVLVHPMEEDGCRFLPCCYGYATTIRRAQGATFFHGCVYFDQKWPAAPGYGYVAVSRFQSRGGCHLYGRPRRTFFLPVGTGKDTEVLKPGYESLASDDIEGPGLEGIGGGDEGDDSEVEYEEPAGNMLADFM